MIDRDQVIRNLIERHRIQFLSYNRGTGIIKIKNRKKEGILLLSQKKLNELFNELEQQWDPQNQQLMMAKIMQFVDSKIDPEIVYETLVLDVYGQKFRKHLPKMREERIKKEEVSLEGFYKLLVESIGGYSQENIHMVGSGRRQFDFGLSFRSKEIYLENLSFDPSTNILTMRLHIHKNSQQFQSSYNQVPRMVSFTVNFPEIISFIILKKCATSSIINYDIAAKEINEISKKLYCSECGIQLRASKQEISDEIIIPIPKEFYNQGELPFYWMCKSCYSLLKPPKRLMKETQQMYANYKVKLPSRFYSLSVD